MSDINRERAIDIIEGMMAEYEESECVATDITMDDECLEALRFARDSLKTDEAYQLEYELTTKNDLGVDIDKLISDCEKMSFDIDFFDKWLKVVALDTVKNIVNELPSVTPQEPKTEWEHDHEILKAYSDGANEVLDKIYTDIQKLRGCSCSCSDGIIDDVENILDKYKGESENP